MQHLSHTRNLPTGRTFLLSRYPSSSALAPTGLEHLVIYTSKGHEDIMSRKLAQGRQLREMDPYDIYFTHARVRPVFTGCNKQIQQTLDEIVRGETKLEDIPYITVIENFEEAPAAPDTFGKKGKGGGKGGAKKGGRRKRGDSSSEEEEDEAPRGGKKKTVAGGGKGGELVPYYFSLNNRRLFLFKTLRDMGLIEKVQVQVKPALEREKTKYTRDRCVLRAKLMGAGAKLDAGDGEAEDADEDGAGRPADERMDED